MMVALKKGIIRKCSNFNKDCINNDEKRNSGNLIPNKVFDHATLKQKREAMLPFRYFRFR
jgi:hypothetical protein